MSENRKDNILVVIDKAIEIFLLILIFTIPIPFHKQTIETACFIFIILLWIIKSFLRPEATKIKASSIDLPILAFTFFIILSIFFSNNPTYSLETFRKFWLKPLLLFYIIVNFMDSKEKLKRLIWMIVISSLVPLIKGIIEFSPTKLHSRLVSFFPSTIQYGQYLVNIIVVMLGIIMWSKPRRKPHPKELGFIYILKDETRSNLQRIEALFQRGKEKLLKIMLSLIITASFFCLVFTYSRTNWICIFIAIVLLCFLKSKKLVLIPVFVAVLFLIFSPPVIKERAISILNVENYVVSTQMSAITLRPHIWKAAITQIRKSPFIGIGFGYKNFKAIFPQLDVPNVIEKKVYVHAHNYYLEIAIELGIVALLVFLWLWIAIIVRSWKNFAFSRDPFIKGVLAGIFVSFIAKSIYWLVQVPLNEQVILPLWLFIGIVMAIKENILTSNKWKN